MAKSIVIESVVDRGHKSVLRRERYTFDRKIVELFNDHVGPMEKIPTEGYVDFSTRGAHCVGASDGLEALSPDIVQDFAQWVRHVGHKSRGLPLHAAIARYSGALKDVGL